MPATALPVPPIDALVIALKRKVVLPDEYYGSLAGVTRAKAFSVAGLASAEQLQAVLDSLNQAMQNGQSFRGWKRDVAAGKVPLDVPVHRLDNIYRTNLQGSYSAGRWTRQKRTANTRPFLMYDAVNDGRTRPAHRAMDGLIFSLDHPFWDTHYPPNGYRCRCTTISLTRDQAEARGGPSLAIPPDAQPDAGWDYHGGGSRMVGIRRALKLAKPKLAPGLAEALREKATGAESYDPDTWVQVGPSLGSNEGGTFEAPDGSRFYVKWYRDPLQAKSEVASAALHRALGVETLDPTLATVRDRLAVVTRWREDLVRATEDLLLSMPEDLARLYQASVLTNDWDCLGMALDNVKVSKAGKLVMVDPGGSFNFRAQGEKKPFGPDLDDLKTLRDPNRTAGKVFHELFRRDVFLEAEGARPLLALERGAVGDIFTVAGFDPPEATGLAETVWARRQFLVDRYDLEGKLTYPGFGKHLDEFRKLWATEAFTDPGAAKHYNTAFLPNVANSLIPAFEGYVKAQYGQSAVDYLKWSFNEGWSGSSTSEGGAMLKHWAMDRFGVGLGYHPNFATARDNYFKTGAARYKLTKAQMLELFDVEYEFQQYYLRRLHGYEEFTLYRGIGKTELQKQFAGETSEGGQGTFTYNAVASTSTARRNAAKFGSSPYIVGTRSGRVEDVAKTFYQGGELHALRERGDGVHAPRADQNRRVADQEEVACGG